MRNFHISVSQFGVFAIRWKEVHEGEGSAARIWSTDLDTCVEEAVGGRDNRPLEGASRQD